MDSAVFILHDNGCCGQAVYLAHYWLPRMKERSLKDNYVKTQVDPFKDANDKLCLQVNHPLSILDHLN